MDLEKVDNIDNLNAKRYPFQGVLEFFDNLIFNSVRVKKDLKVDGSIDTKDINITENLIARDRLISSEKSIYSISNGGILIDTGIASTTLYQMITIEIKGNGYSTSEPINTLIQCYHYTPIGTFLNYKQTNYGGNIGTAKFMLFNEKIYCWIPISAEEFQTYIVKAWGMKGVPLDISLSDSSEPAGTNKVTCSKDFHIGSNKINLDNTGSIVITHTQAWTVQPMTFSSSNSVGNKLTRSANSVMVGAGVSKVELSGMFNYYNNTSHANGNDIVIEYYKNDVQYSTGAYANYASNNSYPAIPLHKIIIDVAEGDLLTYKISRGGAGSFTVFARSSFSVEVVA